MESSNKKRLTLTIRFDNGPSKQTSVYITDKIKSLEREGPKLDFFIHGEKLDI